VKFEIETFAELKYHHLAELPLVYMGFIIGLE
jgi:hypothetical protein